ncbi:MAG: zinc-ribbon domain-containing protein [Planctomycetota bacterium]
MIIFGWTTLTRVVRSLSFGCPTCRCAQHAAIIQHRRWFTLFFIPCIPLGLAKQNLVCGACQTSYDPQLFGLHERPTVSPVLAIVSLVAGIASLPLLMTCFFFIPASLLAILTGHLALSQSDRAGRVMARFGLGAGYASLVIAVGIFAVLFQGNRLGVGEQAAANKDRFDAANRKISSSSRAIASGNTEDAKELASRYGQLLKSASDAAFTGGSDSGVDLTDGKFLTHCELHPESCAFLVHVPHYKEYKDEVREALSTIAWAIAKELTADTLDTGDRLAVAMRGTFIYGDILIGYVPREGNGLVNREFEKHELYAFFPEATQSRENGFGLASESDPTEMSPDAGGYDPQAFARENTARQNKTSPNADSNPRLPSEQDVGSKGIVGADNPSYKSENEPAELGPESDRDLGRPSVDNLSWPESTSKIVNPIRVKERAVIAQKSWAITGLSFQQNDKLLVAGRIDGALLVYDWQSAEKLEDKRIRGRVASLTSSADQTRLLFVDDKGQLAAIDSQPSGVLGEARPLHKHTRGAVSAYPSPRYNFVISGGEDGTVVWEPFDGRQSAARTLEEFDSGIKALFIEPDGTSAMATDGAKLLRFSLRTGEVLESQVLDAATAATTAAFSPDGSRLALAMGGAVSEFDTATGKEVQSLLTTALSVQQKLEYHPTQPWLVSGGNGKVHVWSRDGKRIAEIQMDTFYDIRCFAFGKNSPHLLAVVGDAKLQPIKVFELGD